MKTASRGLAAISMPAGYQRLLSIRDYDRLAAPEPEVLRVIGEESRRKERTSLPHARLIGRSRPRAAGSPRADDSAPAGRRIPRSARALEDEYPQGPPAVNAASHPQPFLSGQNPRVRCK